MPADEREGRCYLPGTAIEVLRGLHLFLVPIADIVPDATNPRVLVDLDGLVDGIREFGVRSPIVCNWRTGHVEAGHQRLAAIRALGAAHAPVLWADEDERRGRAFMISDNRLGETTAIWDEVALGALLRQLNLEDDELAAALGFDDVELTRLLAVDGPGSTGGEPPPKSDLAAQLQVQWGVRAGDLWGVGPHRIFCADCTGRAAVEHLFGDRRVDGLVTDPPYGVDYQDKNDTYRRMYGTDTTSVDRPIANDARADYREFFASFLRLVPFADYNTAYIFMSDRELHHLRLAMEDTGVTCAAVLIWLKNRIVFGRADYHYRHEFIAYGWRGKHEFFGDGKACGVLEFDKPQDSDFHPSTKPVPLVERLIRDGTPPGGLVYDPFLGSGTTVLAAHAAGRTCYGCEADPSYVAVVLERCKEALGVQPQRLEEGHV